MDKAFLQNFSFPVRYSSVKPTACQLLWKRSQNVSSLRGDARQGRGVVPGRWVKYFCKIFSFPVRYSSVKPTACQLLWKRSQNVSSLRGDARQGRGVVPGRWVKYFCKIFLFRYATPQSSLRLASSSGRGAKMSPLLEEMPDRAEESTPTPSSNETKTYSRSRL